MARMIKIRKVWRYNLEQEFSLIYRILPYFPYASMDTEFPGVIYHYPDLHHSSLTPSQNYSIMKKNVDARASRYSIHKEISPTLGLNPASSGSSILRNLTWTRMSKTQNPSLCLGPKALIFP
ncbi:unnamed protein product [Fraxinus pennsylvanica]|uniref:Uncharacterized protein n=1 Tax=Fraxinus pennsylvanica TaxID=56036 RepID=A0AAD1ZL55_9LAMI|nr:unnamed protein product [Fraxinus pennsylvanica]